MGSAWPAEPTPPTEPAGAAAPLAAVPAAFSTLSAPEAPASESGPETTGGSGGLIEVIRGSGVLHAFVSLGLSDGRRASCVASTRDGDLPDVAGLTHGSAGPYVFHVPDEKSESPCRDG